LVAAGCPDISNEKKLLALRLQILRFSCRKTRLLSQKKVILILFIKMRMKHKKNFLEAWVAV